MSNFQEKTEKYAKELFDLVSEELGTSHFYIAGGIIRGYVENIPLEDLGLDDGFKPVEWHTKVSDIDVFTYDATVWQDAKDRLLDIGYEITKERSRSSVFKKPDGYEIDLVLLENITCAKHIIDDFDFTNCCVAYGKEGLITHPNFFHDVINKEIKINMAKLPYHTIQRAAKFKKKGYSIDNQTAMQMFEYAMKAPWGFDKEKEYSESV